VPDFSNMGTNQIAIVEKPLCGIRDPVVHMSRFDQIGARSFNPDLTFSNDRKQLPRLCRWTALVRSGQFHRGIRDVRRWHDCA
jgi:hypothetical protein